MNLCSKTFYHPSINSKSININIKAKSIIASEAKHRQKKFITVME